MLVPNNILLVIVFIVRTNKCEENVNIDESSGVVLDLNSNVKKSVRHNKGVRMIDNSKLFRRTPSPEMVKDDASLGSIKNMLQIMLEKVNRMEEAAVAQTVRTNKCEENVNIDESSGVVLDLNSNVKKSVRHNKGVRMIDNSKLFRRTPSPEMVKDDASLGSIKNMLQIMLEKVNRMEEAAVAQTVRTNKCEENVNIVESSGVLLDLNSNVKKSVCHNKGVQMIDNSKLFRRTPSPEMVKDDASLGSIKNMLQIMLEKVNRMEEAAVAQTDKQPKLIDIFYTPTAYLEVKKRKSGGKRDEEPGKRNEKPPKWDKWTDWSTCSVSCGKGREIRWRHCLEECSDAETEMEEKTCQLPACAPSKLFGIKI